MEKGEGYVEFKFELNPFEFDFIDKGDIGILEFSEVYKVDFGTMNDEGYYMGQHRYNNDVLPWGEFYELIDSNWRTDFPKSSPIINSELDESELRHFIFFLRGNTIECLAIDYSFSMRFAKQSHYDAKYPNEYFDHYISMFSTNYSEIDENNLRDFNSQYIEFEGKEEFKELQFEVAKIKDNKDFDWYLKQAKADEIENVDLSSIKQIIDSVLIFNYSE